MERAADADSLVESRDESIGSVYLVGYALECALKGLLRRRNQQFPASGREGHNLRRLWEKAGFRKADISDHTGNKTFFFDGWSTDLRYEVMLEETLDHRELVRAARRLSGMIQTRARRGGRRNRR